MHKHGCKQKPCAENDEDAKQKNCPLTKLTRSNLDFD